MNVTTPKFAWLLVLIGWAAACSGESGESSSETMPSVTTTPSTTVPAASGTPSGVPSGVAPTPTPGPVQTNPAGQPSQQTPAIPTVSTPRPTTPTTVQTTPPGGPDATQPTPSATLPAPDATTPTPDGTGDMPGPDATSPMDPGPDLPTEPVEMLSEAVQFYMDFCARCHGDSGEGVDEKGPAIEHPVREFGEYLVRNGRSHEDYMEDMPAMDENVVSTELLNEIWDYLDEPEKPTDGEGLYVDYCKNCHGDDGNAVPNHGIGGAMKATASEYIMNARRGHHGGEFDNRGGYMPAYDEQTLSDDELTLIAEYVASL